MARYLFSLLLFLCLSFGFTMTWAQEASLNQVFEDVTREDTVQAFIAFMDKYPQSEYVKKARELLSVHREKALRSTFSVKKTGGWCGIRDSLNDVYTLGTIWTQCRAASRPDFGKKEKRYVGSCYQVAGSVKNKSKYHVFAKYGDQVKLIAPGKSGIFKEKSGGFRTSNASCVSQKKVVQFRFQTEKPKPGKLVAAFLTPGEVVAYQKAMKKKAELSTVSAFVKTYPHSPLFSEVEKKRKELQKNFEKALKSKIKVSVNYKKKVSRMYATPYELSLTNTTSEPVVANLAFEGEPRLVPLRPGESAALSAETKKGGEAAFEIKDVDLVDFQPASFWVRDSGNRNTTYAFVDWSLGGFAATAVQFNDKYFKNSRLTHTVGQGKRHNLYSEEKTYYSFDLSDGDKAGPLHFICSNIEPRQAAFGCKDGIYNSDYYFLVKGEDSSKKDSWTPVSEELAQSLSEGKKWQGVLSMQFDWPGKGENLTFHYEFTTDGDPKTGVVPGKGYLYYYTNGKRYYDGEVVINPMAEVTVKTGYIEDYDKKSERFEKAYEKADVSKRTAKKGGWTFAVEDVNWLIEEPNPKDRKAFPRKLPIDSLTLPALVDKYYAIAADAGVPVKISEKETAVVRLVLYPDVGHRWSALSD